MSLSAFLILPAVTLKEKKTPMDEHMEKYIEAGFLIISSAPRRVGRYGLIRSGNAVVNTPIISAKK